MTEPQIVERKIFENFSRVCRDRHAWQAACVDQRNDSYRRVRVDTELADADQECLRQWLLQHGVTEEDEYVFLRISW